MDAKISVDDINKNITRLWSIMHNRNKNNSAVLNREELNSLLNNLISLKELNSIPNGRNYKKLISFIEEYNENKIKDNYKWYKRFFLTYTKFVQQLGIYIQKQRLKKWGDFWFSKIFPKSFEYLKEYVPVRHLEYYSKSLPDVKVKIFSTSQNQINHFVSGGGMAYDPNDKKIYVNLTLWSPGSIPKNDKEVRKLLMYFDSITKYQSMLIHEYEHFLQHKIVRFNLFKPSTWGASGMSDNLPKIVGIRFSHELENEFPEFRKAKKSFVSYALELEDNLLINIHKKHNSLNLTNEDARPHRFRPIEIDAHLAQLIFFLTKGYSLDNALEAMRRFSESPPFDTYTNLLEVLYETAKELKELLDHEKDEEKVKEIRTNLMKVEKDISIAKQLLNDWDFLINESQKIASIIIKRRQNSELTDIK